MSNCEAAQPAREIPQLWDLATTQSAQALRSGALQPIRTQTTHLIQARTHFTIHTLAQPSPKPPNHHPQKGPTRNPPNPFLPPYDPDLFVADLSATHVCLLNKFPVLANHLLIVTRAYESQERLLSLADFQALWQCMAQMDGLAFYNGGPVAGASQPHKHLQWVPAQGNPDLISLEARLIAAPGLPFSHAFVRLDPRGANRPALAARTSLVHYHRLLLQIGLTRTLADPAQPGPYNLLMTRRWMLIIPRRRMAAAGIEVNGLGFAGSLLVRTPAQMAHLRRRTPLLLLRDVVDRRRSSKWGEDRTDENGF